MKAKDLIKILEKNPEAEVIVTSSNTMEHGGRMIAVTSVNEMTGTKKTQTCRDAFDGGMYEQEFWGLSTLDTQNKEVEPIFFIS